MDKHELTDEDSKQNLDQQIKDLLKKLEILNEERIILKNATDLEEMERKIIATTDKLAGLRQLQENKIPSWRLNNHIPFWQPF